MPKAKIVFIEGINLEYESMYRLVDSSIEWEEVSDKDLQVLRSNMHLITNMINKKSSSIYTIYASLVELDGIPIQTRVESINTYLESIKEKNKKVEKARLKDEEKARRNKEEKERKKYEELAKKYGKNE
jgi:hypothetical protein